MALYTYHCEMGHEKETFTADADTDEAAMTSILGQCKAHLQKVHSDMGGKSDEELTEMIKSSWIKA